MVDQVMPKRGANLELPLFNPDPFDELDFCCVYGLAGAENTSEARPRNPV